MISRRNIRVKVMQTLYTLSSSEYLEVNKPEIPDRILNEKLEHVLDIFTVAVLYTIRIAQYASTDAQNRSFKYLRSDEDLNVNTSISDNSFVTRIATNASFIEKIKVAKLERFIDQEWVKKIYQQLTKTEQYSKYIANSEPNPSEQKDIIRFIWEKQILENEGMVSFFNDELPGWEDDAELIGMLMQNFFNGNTKIDFMDLLTGEKREYAHELLHAVLDKKEYCMELIEPKLKNWDKDRVALIDLLLLRMGVCELLYFPTIPTKVSINEYIDIAKQYSTPQSGQFVNGVLDNILKELVKENKINKVDRLNN
jgi:transcription antitermination protein NusB